MNPLKARALPGLHGWFALFALSFRRKSRLERAAFFARYRGRLRSRYPGIARGVVRRLGAASAALVRWALLLQASSRFRCFGAGDEGAQRPGGRHVVSAAGRQPGRGRPLLCEVLRRRARWRSSRVGRRRVFRFGVALDGGRGAGRRPLLCFGAATERRPVPSSMQGVLRCSLWSRTAGGVRCVGAFRRSFAGVERSGRGRDVASAAARKRPGPRWFLTVCASALSGGSRGDVACVVGTSVSVASPFLRACFSGLHCRASARRRGLWLWCLSGAFERHEGNGAGDGARPREGNKALKGTTP